MQPRNDEPAAAPLAAELDGAAGADEAADVVLVAAGALDVLLPHAAITRLAATAAAAAINAEFFTVSSTGRVLPVPRRDRTSPSLDCRKISSR
jgi:hypothetical protein